MQPLVVRTRLRSPWQRAAGLLALALITLLLREANGRFLPPERFLDGDSVCFCRLAGMVAEGQPVGTANTRR
jgi:hypothetical protein